MTARLKPRLLQHPNWPQTREREKEYIQGYEDDKCADKKH